jgi:hypothetical protein
MRPIGFPDAIFSSMLPCTMLSCVISLANHDGAIALTVMPSRAHSTASCRVRFSAPPLLAA